MIRPLRAELLEPATRRRRAGAGPSPRSQRVARRTDGCSEGAREPASAVSATTLSSVRAPGSHSGMVPSDLSPVAHLLCAGLQVVGDLTVSRNRFACRLVGSADRLARHAIALGGEIVQTEESDGQSSYSFHWIAPYESDVWD